MAQTTETITRLFTICAAWERSKAGHAEAEAAAECFTFSTEEEKAQFVSFYAGYLSGHERISAAHPHDHTTAARLAGGLDEQPGTAKRREAAAQLAVECIEKCRVYDTDTAATIYNTVREQRPGYPLEFILGDIYCAGIERGRERERSAQRKKRSPLPEAKRISTGESPAERERRIAAAAEYVKLIGYAPISVCDTAAAIYNAAKAADPADPFTILLGRIFFAGRIDGQRMERQRRKAAASHE